MSGELEIVLSLINYLLTIIVPLVLLFIVAWFKRRELENVKRGYVLRYPDDLGLTLTTYGITASLPGTTLAPPLHQFSTLLLIILCILLLVSFNFWKDAAREFRYRKYQAASRIIGVFSFLAGFLFSSFVFWLGIPA